MQKTLKDTNKRFDFNLNDDTKSDLFIKDIACDLNPKPTIDNYLQQKLKYHLFHIYLFTLRKRKKN